MQKQKSENSSESLAMPPAAKPEETSQRKKAKKSDPHHWMKRVSKLARKAAKDFDEDAVHDLRTALRRCRSIAVALEAVDPSSDWQRVEEESERLLDGLGKIRDAQVLAGLVQKLHMKNRPAGEELLWEIDQLEQRGEKRAARRLRKFPAKRWRSWARKLPERAMKLPRDGAVVGLLALEHWKDCWQRHRFAMRSRSKISIHKLRVSVKRFRYFVENFLPKRYELWSADFRRVQDVLGDTHDLDVLQSYLIGLRNRISEDEREKWLSVIGLKRAKLLAQYHKIAGREKSVWNEWRAGLPPQQELDRDRVELLAAWASYLDPNPQHSRRVARLALQIFDGLQSTGLSASGVPHSRIALECAAIIHDVGLHDAHKNHHKSSYKLVHHRNPPPGWSAERMHVIALVARYHRGALPQDVDTEFAGLKSGEAAGVLFLSGILRLAVALVSDPLREIRRITISAQANEVVIRAAGYEGAEPLASNLAAARHLLETELDRPVMIVPMEKFSGD
jgi:CHAD domain-containing protein